MRVALLLVEASHGVLVEMAGQGRRIGPGREPPGVVGPDRSLGQVRPEVGPDDLHLLRVAGPEAQADRAVEGARDGLEGQRVEIARGLDAEAGLLARLEAAEEDGPVVDGAGRVEAAYHVLDQARIGGILVDSAGQVDDIVERVLPGIRRGADVEQVVLRRIVRQGQGTEPGRAEDVEGGDDRPVPLLVRGGRELAVVHPEEAPLVDPHGGPVDPVLPSGDIRREGEVEILRVGRNGRGRQARVELDDGLLAGGQRGQDEGGRGAQGPVAAPRVAGRVLADGRYLGSRRRARDVLAPLDPRLARVPDGEVEEDRLVAPGHDDGTAVVAGPVIRREGGLKGRRAARGDHGAQVLAARLGAHEGRRVGRVLDLGDRLAGGPEEGGDEVVALAARHRHREAAVPVGRDGLGIEGVQRVLDDEADAGRGAEAPAPGQAARPVRHADAGLRKTAQDQVAAPRPAEEMALPVRVRELDQVRRPRRERDAVRVADHAVVIEQEGGRGGGGRVVGEPDLVLLPVGRALAPWIGIAPGRAAAQVPLRVRAQVDPAAPVGGGDRGLRLGAGPRQAARAVEVEAEVGVGALFRVAAGGRAQVHVEVVGGGEELARDEGVAAAGGLVQRGHVDLVVPADRVLGGDRDEEQVDVLALVVDAEEIRADRRGEGAHDGRRGLGRLVGAGRLARRVAGGEGEAEGGNRPGKHASRADGGSRPGHEAPRHLRDRRPEGRSAEDIASGDSRPEPAARRAAGPHSPVAASQVLYRKRLILREEVFSNSRVRTWRSEIFL